MDKSHKPLGTAFFALLSLPSTAMGFALSIQIVALSWLLQTQLHLNIEQVGYVWLSGPVAGIFGQVLIGLASDRVWFLNGRRRPFILLGGLTASAMLLALPRIPEIARMVQVAPVIVALVVSTIFDMAINVGYNPARSIIADVTRDGEERTRGFTWMQSISGFFGVLAYLLSYAFGNFLLINIGVVLVFAFTVIPPLFVQEPRHLAVDLPETTAEAAPAPTDKQQLELAKVYLAHAFTWLGVQTMFVYMMAFATDRLGLTQDVAGQMLAWAFLVMNIVGFILPSVALGPLARRWGRVRTHSASLAVMACGYLALALFANTTLVAYMLMAVVGVGWAATVSLPFAIFSEKVHAAKMGLYMGIFNLSVVLPQIVVSSLFGRIILNATDKGVIFYIAAGSLALSSVLWLTVRDSNGPLANAAAGGHH